VVLKSSALIIGEASRCSIVWSLWSPLHLCTYMYTPPINQI